jgi:arylsulfatase A-like enzyme
LVPQKYRDLYDSSSLTLRPNVQSEVNNPLAAGKDCRETYARYYAAITALDSQLGRLLAAIEDNGIMSETLVVFTSDHGDMLWSHGLMKKQTPFQESIHVPFLASQPGRIQAGSVSDCLMGTYDILPTLCGYLGWDTDAPFDGEDVSRAWKESSHRRSEPLLITNYVQDGEAMQQGMPEWRGVYTGSETYVEQHKGDPWLYFDNVQDPFQQKNLATRQDAAPAVGRLQEQLRIMLERAADPFVPGEECIRRLGLDSQWEPNRHDWFSQSYERELEQDRACLGAMP